MPSIRLTAPSENAVLYGTPGGVINLLIKGNCDDTGAPDGLGVTTVEAGGPPLTVDASDGTFQRTVPLSTRGQLVVKATIHWSTANPSGPTKPPIHHSASASRTVTLVDDTVGPTIAIVSPQRNASLPIAELGGSFELRVNVQDVGVGLANPAVIEWSLDGSVGSGFVADSAPPGSYVAIVPWPIRLRVPGEDVVNVRAQDAAGNWSDWASVDFFVFDNTAPSASITSPIDLYRVAIGQSLFIEGTVTDRQSGVKQLEWSFEDGTPVVAQSWPAPAVPNTNGVPWSLRIDPSNLPAPGGPYTLTLRFTDWSGNSATTPLQVEVLRQVVPLNAGDLIGSREYLRALLSFSKAHVRRGEGAAFIDDELLAAIFGQNFSALSTSLSASNIAPVNQARLCIEILRTQLSTLPGFDPTPPTDYLDAAYDSLLRQIGTSHDELRLIRGADPERKLTLTRRLGIGDDIAKLDRLLLRRGEDLTEAMLQRLFGFQVSGVSGGTSVSNEDGEFFTWQQTQRRLEWANADRALPWPLIDPDVVGRQGLSGDASTAQFALWSSRRQQVKQREAALRSILAASQSFTPLQALNSLVADAFSTWAPADQVLRRLEQLVDLVDNQGQRIDRQLAALFLDISCLRRLARVASLARAATDWRDLSGQDFDDVVHILVRVWKLRQHSIWRIEEGAQGISLSSIFFRLSLDTPPSLPNTGFLDGAAIGAGNNATGWTVTIPAGGPPAGLPKVVRTQPAVWLTDDGKSRWINPSGDGNDLLPAGEYVYATRIDLDGWDLSTVELTVGVAVDDVLSAISITSTEEPGVTRRIDVGVSGYSTFHWVAIDAGILFSGINEIAFHVVNGGASANPTGLRVEFHWGGSPNRIRTSAWRWVAPALRQLPAPDAVTGRTGSVTGTPDQLWAITASPTGAPALGPAFISATTAAGWLDNTSSTGSRWISPLADGSANLRRESTSSKARWI